MKRIKFNKIKEFLKKVPKNLAEKSFLTFLLLFLIACIIGVYLFYTYAIAIKNLEPKPLEKSVQFNDELYQEILLKLNKKEKVFEDRKSVV